MDKISSNFWKIFPYRRERKTSEFLVDFRVIRDRDTKIENVWSWKRMKYEKFAVTKCGEKIEVKKIE